MAGIIQALLWLKHVDKTTRTAAICYDSEWAANMTQGKWTVKKRAVKEIVAWAQELLAEVRTKRNVHFIHVRGHSSDDGNDRADALVQWGKKKPDRSRLREHRPSWQEEIIIITREGPIESDGTYGRLAMEEQAREKKEKERQKEEAERNSTSRRRQKQPSVGAAAQHHQTPNGSERGRNPERDAGHNRMRSRNNTCSGSRGTGANRRRSAQRAGARQRRRSSSSSSTDRSTPVE